MLIMTDETKKLAHNKARLDLEMISSLSANVSHDMRAPLNCISKSIDMLIDDNRRIVTNPAVINLLKPIKNASVILNC